MWYISIDKEISIPTINLVLYFIFSLIFLKALIPRIKKQLEKGREHSVPFSWTNINIYTSLILLLAKRIKLKT